MKNTVYFVNPLEPKGSPFDEYNRLALDSKIYKSLLGIKGLKEIVINPLVPKGSPFDE